MEINSGDTAWVLVSAALVLLMTPGVAFFYGGMVRAKSVLNMMMMSFGAMATVGVLWVLFGYSEAFGSSIGGVIGNPLEFAGLKGLMAPSAVSGTVPTLAFVAFQAMFAIIAVALISGAIADRTKFSTWLVFTVLWAVIVYFPIAHWVFAFDSADGSTKGGWIANGIKALDFAGGTAIHINAGSALGANTLAAVAFINTLAATSAAIIGWLIVERIRDGHATSLGAASGTVAGLVGITPAANSVSPLGAVVLGVITGACCAWAVSLKNRFNYDDSLDVVGVHLVGGLVGTLLIGFLATDASPAGVDGLLYGGGFDQLWRQAVGAFSVLITSFVVSYVIGMILHKTMGFRIDHDHELEGIDLHQHAESAYELLGQRGVRSLVTSAARVSTTSGDRHDTSAAQTNQGAVSS